MKMVKHEGRDVGRTKDVGYRGRSELFHHKYFSNFIACRITLTYTLHKRGLLKIILLSDYLIFH